MNKKMLYSVQGNFLVQKQYSKFAIHYIIEVKQKKRKKVQLDLSSLPASTIS